MRELEQTLVSQFLGMIGIESIAESVDELQFGAQLENGR